MIHTHHTRYTTPLEVFFIFVIIRLGLENRLAVIVPLTAVAIGYAWLLLLNPIPPPGEL